MKTALPHPTPWPEPRKAAPLPARPETRFHWTTRCAALLERWTPAPVLNCGGWTP